ncbi:MAG: acetate kinase [Pontimonas sp.]|jgi:acetate kinase
MQILVLNAGSSSLKYRIVDTDSGDSLYSGLVENIGEGQSGPTHREAIEQALESVPHGARIDAVGHRVVHGGARFVEPTIITPEVEDHIADLSPLAPLHNPANLAGIAAAQKALSELVHVAVFDTAFHHTLSEAATTLALPRELRESLGIRKYGFHGTSHQYVSRVASTLLGGDPGDHRIVSLHLGNGSSAAAILGGRCVDTSMGFTPTSGLVMGTRPGDLDPSIVTHLVRTGNFSADYVAEMLSKNSGLLALAGTSDFREITAAASRGEEPALVALDVWAWRIRHYIGAYAALLGGLDALVFTGGIGENSAEGRVLATQGLEFLGVTVDPSLNFGVHSGARSVSLAYSGATVMVIPTNEEREIAQQTASLVSSAR